MNELLAIVLIVVLCCVMFLAWLISMAMCPDAMVNFLSGSSTKKTNSSRESRELIRKSDDSVDTARGRAATDEQDVETGVATDASLMARSVSAVLQINAARRTMEDKKLSVVDEVDEQLTLQSTIHSGGRPTILKHPVTQVVAEMHDEPSSNAKAEEL